MRSINNARHESPLKRGKVKSQIRYFLVIALGFLIFGASLGASGYVQQSVDLVVEAKDIISKQSLPAHIKVNGNAVSPLPHIVTVHNPITLEAASQTASLPNEVCFFLFWQVADRNFHTPTVTETLTASATATAWYSCFSTFQSGINVDAWSFEVSAIPGGAPITATPPPSIQRTPFFSPLRIGDRVTLQAPCEVTTSQFKFAFNGWAVAQGVKVLQEGGSCFGRGGESITVELTNPFATLIVFYEASPIGDSTLTVEATCSNAEITVTPDPQGKSTTVPGQPPTTFTYPSPRPNVTLFASPRLTSCGPWTVLMRFSHWELDRNPQPKRQNPVVVGYAVTHAKAVYEPGSHGRGCEVMIDAKADSTPIPGVYIKVSPPDDHGSGDGQTPFVRLFDENTEFTLDAPLEWPQTAPKYGFDVWDVQGAQVTPISRTAVKLRCTSGNVWATALYEKGFLALADLTVVSLSVLASRPDKTGMCDVKGFAVIKNIGNGDAGTFSTGIFVDGRLDFDFPSAGLKAGASASVPILTMLPRGMHLIEAVADWKNEVNESNEQNNKAARIVECKGE